MPNIILVINVCEIIFHVGPDTNMAISDNNLNWPPIILDFVHAALKSFPFNGITAAYFSNLNNLKINDFVSFLVNHCICAIFDTNCSVLILIVPS